MGIADSMKGITENIIASHDARVEGLTDLTADTNKILKDARSAVKDFAQSRKKMANEQAENLANFTKGLAKNVEDLLNGHQKNRKNMAEAQAKTLGDFAKNMSKNVSSMLAGFTKDRSKMSAELKEKLTKDVYDIKTHVKKLLGDTDKLVNEYCLDMEKAKASWQGMAASLARSRKGGVMSRIEAGEKVATVEKAVKEKGKKKRGKKRGRKKNR